MKKHILVNAPFAVEDRAESIQSGVVADIKSHSLGEDGTLYANIKTYAGSKEHSEGMKPLQQSTILEGYSWATTEEQIAAKPIHEVICELLVPEIAKQMGVEETLIEIV